MPTHVILDGIGHPIGPSPRYTIGVAGVGADLALPDAFSVADDCTIPIVRESGRLWLVDTAAPRPGGTSSSTLAPRTPIEAGDRLTVRCGTASTDLLFAHWPLDPAVLRPLVPAALELDTIDGRAWLGIVPFRMEDVAPRGLPAIPGLSVFPELNVRTYVAYRGSPGVWFLSLDADSWPTVVGDCSLCGRMISRSHTARPSRKLRAIASSRRPSRPSFWKIGFPSRLSRYSQMSCDSSMPTPSSPTR